MAISFSAPRFVPHSHISTSTILRTVLNRLEMQRSRGSLARLDAKALRDIGLSPADANREAQRPIWDAPDHWLK